MNQHQQDDLNARLRARSMNLPRMVRCDHCSMPYYQTSAPHVCAGWTTREKRTMMPNNHSCTDLDCPCHEWTRQPSTNEHEHEPVARGGEGERVRIELISGVEGQCVSINDYRICGPKPWGGGSVAKSWNAEKNDILRAFLTPNQKHAWLADDLEVVSVNQHHSLLAERERLRTVLRKTLKAIEVIDFSNCREGAYDSIPWTEIETAIDQKEGEG